MEKLVNLYAKIYSWHKNLGKRTYLEKFPDHQQSKYFVEYLIFLEKMPNPKYVETTFIKEVARQQLSGLFEWSYREKYENEIPLNKIAKEILHILEELETNEKNNDSNTQFENFSNIDTEEPSVIEIEFINKSYDEYIELSKKAYSDVPTDYENLGGANLLSDTNWEYNKQYFHNSELRIIKFYNASALHFQEITEDDVISTMVKNGTITIESIKIG